jgi:hypothetical protein
MRPIPDPEVSPLGPTLGPAATTPLLIDPKDHTAFAWPSRRAWGYAPIPGRGIPVVAATYTTVDGLPSGAKSNPVSTAPAAAVRHETSYPPVSSTGPVSSNNPATSVRSGDGWTRSGTGGGGWQAVGR